MVKVDFYIKTPLKHSIEVAVMKLYDVSSMMLGAAECCKVFFKPCFVYIVWQGVYISDHPVKCHKSVTCSRYTRSFCDQNENDASMQSYYSTIIICIDFKSDASTQDLIHL